MKLNEPHLPSFRLNRGFLNEKPIDLGFSRVSYTAMTESLDSIFAEICHHLQCGATNRRSLMHTPVIATADGDLRVMVLRGFDKAAMTLRFHTDSRSPKAAEIARDPAISILFYDPEAKVQIRAKGMGRIETDGALVDAAWKQAAPFAKRCYLAEYSPSAASASPTSGLPDWVEGITPTQAQVEAGRKNFAVLLVQIEAFDWLHLANTGHRRARFECGNGEFGSTWLVP